MARCSSPLPPPPPPVVVGEEEGRAEGGGDGNCLSVPQGRRRPGRLRVSWIVGRVWLWWWRVVFARTDGGHRERSQGPRGGGEKLAFKRRAWKRNEGPGKERKEERLQTSSNVSPGMLGGVRRGEWAPGWAWDGMGCEQRLTNGEFQPQCEFHGRPGQRQLRRIVALEGERGARVGALGCLRRLSLPLSLSLSSRTPRQAAARQNVLELGPGLTKPGQARNTNASRTNVEDGRALLLQLLKTTG